MVVALVVVRTVVALAVVRTVVVACIAVASEAVDRIVVGYRIVVVHTAVADRMVVVVAAAWVPVQMVLASEIVRTLMWGVEPWVVVEIAVADPCHPASRIHQSYLAGCSKVPRLQGLSS